MVHLGHHIKGRASLDQVSPGSPALKDALRHLVALCQPQGGLEVEKVVKAVDELWGVPELQFCLTMVDRRHF